MAAGRRWIPPIAPELRDFLRETGEGVAQGQVSEWLRDQSYDKVLTSPGVVGWMSRAFARAPPPVQDMLASLLGTALERLPLYRLPSTMRRPAKIAAFAAAAVVREIPNDLRDKQRTGEIDADSLEAHVRAKIQGPFDKLLSYFDESGGPVADVNASGGAASAPRPDLVAAARADAINAERQAKQMAIDAIANLEEPKKRAIALYTQILLAFFERDHGPAPRDAHTMHALLTFLGYCSSARAALPDISDDELQQGLNSLTWLREDHRRGSQPDESVGRRRRTMRQHEEQVQDLLNKYATFEAMLRLEGMPHLKGFQRYWLPIRDRLNDWITPQTRARWSARFESIQNSRLWPVLVVVLLGLPLIMWFSGLIFLGMEALFAGLAGFQLIFGWSALDKSAIITDPEVYQTAYNVAWWFLWYVCLVGVFRLLAIIGDWAGRWAKQLGDTASLTDGTGAIGGTVAAIGEALRVNILNLPPIPPEVLEKRAQGVVTVSNATFIKDIATAITLGASAVTIGMAFSFLGYGVFGVVPTLQIVSAALAVAGVELLTRGRYIPAEAESKMQIDVKHRVELSKATLRFVGRGLIALCALLLISTAIIGPSVADEAFETAQAGSRRALRQGAKFAGLPYTKKQCSQALDSLTREIPMGESPRSYVDGVCSRHPEEKLCACDLTKLSTRALQYTPDQCAKALDALRDHAPNGIPPNTFIDTVCRNDPTQPWCSCSR